MSAGIENIDHGMSVAKITNYFEALRTGAIQNAMNTTAPGSPEFQNMVTVLGNHWVGTSHDNFVRILTESATVTAETIGAMTTTLATQFNRMIEVWREQEDKLVID